MGTFEAVLSLDMKGFEKVRSVARGGASMSAGRRVLLESNESLLESAVLVVERTESLLERAGSLLERAESRVASKRDEIPETPEES